jgi:putative acetyltransferase
LVESPATIRREQPGDAPQIREVNQQAFGRPIEADIVDALRESGCPFLSLVAQVGNRVVGHILFTPVTVETAEGPLQGMGLAPMAVLPQYQRRGIGSLLAQRGIAEVRSDGYPFIVVLGHPDYYPRFGFEPASRYGLACQYEGVPDEAFMVLVLEEAALKNAAGVVRYRQEFAAAV